MRLVTLLLASSLATSCALQPKAGHAAAPELARAEALIDAFYSFETARLRPLMARAPSTLPRLLYYQGWAQGGNYRVVDRKPCRFDKADEVSCTIIVKDDLIAALGTGYDVADTFHVSFRQGRIVAVRNSSNDPPEFEQALKWLDKQHPTLFDEACRGFFKGGPTPQACVREVVKGMREYAAREK